MKNLALIGVSGYARTHLLLAQEQVLQGRARLAAVTVINPMAEAFLCRRLEALGCEIFPDTGAMWRAYAGRIDLCLIPTGIHFHAPLSIEALCAGANVLVEKPLAGSDADAEAVQATERETGRFVAVAFQDVYLPAAQCIKRRLISGEFGRLQSIAVTGLWPRSQSYYGRNDWGGRLVVDRRIVNDSPVSNAFAHFLHLALFWAAEEFAESARLATVEASLWRAQPIESFDTAIIAGRTMRGVPFRAYLSHASREHREAEITVETDKATLTWRHLTRCEIAWRDGRDEAIPLLGSLEARLTMMDAVLQRLDRSETFVCTTQMAGAHVNLVERLHATTAIHDVPVEFIDHVGSGENPTVAIRGLERYFAEAAMEQARRPTLEASGEPRRLAAETVPDFSLRWLKLSFRDRTATSATQSPQ